MILKTNGRMNFFIMANMLNEKNVILYGFNFHFLKLFYTQRKKKFKIISDVQ